MIAKCLALLAVVAQINCYGVTSNCGSPVVVSGCGSTGVVGSGLVGTTGVVGSGVVGTTGVVGSGVVGTTGVVGSGVVGTTGVVGSGVVGTTGSGAVTRNLVAKGKYPVALSNTGPVPDSRIPVSTSHVQAPVQEKPTVRLPARIPAPRTVAHSCTCYKTIVRPRVHDQYICVPTVQRYIETLHKPVVENIQYEAVPVNDPSTYGSVATGVDAAASVISSGYGVSPAVSTGYGVSSGVSPVISGYETSPAVATGYAVSPAVSTGCGVASYPTVSTGVY